MKRFTKVLSMFLAFIMLASLLPLAAFAGNLDNESHIVQFKLNYNGAKKLAAQKVSDGECAVEPEDAVRTGWILEYWYQKTDSGIQKYDFSKPVTEDMTLYARWKEDITYWGPIWSRNIQNAISAGDTAGDTEEGLYTVTFEANGDNVSNLPAVQYVQVGNCAEEPDAPTREGYLFLGWSAGTNGILYNFDTEVTGDLTLYAQWGSISGNEVSGSGTTDPIVYAISNMTVENNYAATTVYTVDKCKLRIIFYDEEQETILGSLEVDVPEKLGGEPVEAEISFELPEYFMATAQLFDYENNALCNTYTCIEYTQAYEEYLEKTVDSFPGKTVLNFDDSSETNFGVLSDNVIIISCGEDSNVLTEKDEEQYVLESPSAEAAALKVGDIVLLQDTESDYLLKIGNISQTDTAITLIPGEGEHITEYYSYLKVDMTAYAAAEEPEDTPQVFSRTRADDNVLKPLEIPLKFSTIPLGKTAALDISGKVIIQSRLVIQYDIELFGEDYIKLDFINSFIGEATFGVTSTDPALKPVSYMEEIDMGRVAIPFGVTGFAAYVDASFQINLKFQAGITVKVKFEQKKGFTYNSIDGVHFIDNPFTPTVTANVNAEISFEAGPHFNVGIDFLDDVFDAHVGAFFKGKLVGKAQVLDSLTLTPGVPASAHYCYACIDGDGYLVYGFDAGIKVFGKKIPFFNYEFMKVEKKVLDCYCSLLNSVDSVFGGQTSFGIGTCPNVAYRVRIYGIDDEGNNVENCPITVTNTESGESFEGTTPYTAYLHNGNYTITAMIEGKTVTETFHVFEAAKDIYLSETGIADHNLLGRYYSADTASAYIEFTDPGKGYIYIVPFDTVAAFAKEFTYTIKNDIITITSVDEDFGYKENSQWIKSLKFKIQSSTEIVLESLNSWGNVDKGDIFRKPSVSADDLVGRTYMQTTSIEGVSPIPSIHFTDTNSGVITLNYLEGYTSNEFTYEIIGHRVHLYSEDENGLYVVPGIALEMEFSFVDENTLKLVGYYPRIVGGEGSGGDLIHLGATNIGDIFEVNR